MQAAVRALKRGLWALPPVRSLHHRRRARRDAALLDPRRPEQAPILVYQMAKVGSTTVQATLASLDPPRRPALKVHYLSPAGIRRERALDARSVGWGYVGYQAAVGAALSARLSTVGSRIELPVISLVRDPIGRAVSGLFQRDYAGVQLRDRHGGYDVDRVLAYLSERFATADPCGGAEAWFEEELHTVFGVDVFAQPFPRERGYTILPARRARVLLLRTEDLDTTLGPALAELLDLEKEPPVVRSNERRRTRDADAYTAVLERFRLPAEIVREIYARRLVRHFYTGEMIESFTRRWTHPAA